MKKLITKEMIQSLENDSELEGYDNDISMSSRSEWLNIDGEDIQITVNSSLEIDQETVSQKLYRLTGLQGKMLPHLVNSHTIKNDLPLWEMEENCKEDFEFTPDAMSYIQQRSKELDILLVETVTEQMKNKYDL